MSLDALLRRRPEFEPRPELLLHQQIPKPMHGVAPRAVLGDEWWAAERKRALRSTGQRCAACGADKGSLEDHPWLECHEVYDIDYRFGRMTHVETVPLCHLCHSFIHGGRVEALVESGQMTEDEGEEIVDHGRQILRAAGLWKRWKRRHDPTRGECAPWSQWRLIAGGRSFPPKFRDFDEWRKAMADGRSGP